MARYVVSLPPVMVNRPGGSSTTTCLRDRSAVRASPSPSSGRSPAQEATTSPAPTPGKFLAIAARM